jgi:hypothetical protein
MVFLPGRIFGWRTIYSEIRFPPLTKLGLGRFRIHAPGTTKARPGGCRLGSFAYRIDTRIKN